MLWILLRNILKSKMNNIIEIYVTSTHIMYINKHWPIGGKMNVTLLQQFIIELLK